MAEAALSFLLENVRKLMVEQIKLIWGAEKELKLLQNDLELMKAFLVMEVANKRDKGELFIQFAKQMREEVFDAENTLDAFLMRKARGSGSSGFNNTNLANKVKELREKLKPMFEKAMAALLMAHESATSTGAGISDDSLKKMQSLREHNVVGLEDEEATIISNLLQQTEELDVISIVGMPGLGKTTLAWKIYSNPEIRNKFSELIWVHVSQKFNARDVFLTILKNFTDQNMSVKDNQELTQAVRYHLNEAKKFLLFIDDVWTVGDWKQIEAVLPKSANNVRKVVITSRQTRVAKQANRSREPHVLRFFTLEESWKLLQLEVFGNNCTPIELEELGQKIAMQCRGLPLTVVVIGVVLVQKGNRRDLWDDISESVSTYVLDDEQKRTANIIELSYNKMPPDLRDCFLYLGMFPKGGEISAWKLTRLWIAEGFIQKKRGKSLEEVSEDKLKDLVAMSLVMVEKTKANGDIRTCRVHDMIREFCHNEAAFDNKNMFQEVKKTTGSSTLLYLRWSSVADSLFIPM